MNQRIKGQETQLFMTQDNVTQASIDSVRNFEITLKLEKKEEGYLGETSNRYDDIFNGVDGNFEIHLTTAVVYNLVQAIVDRARRRVPGTKFSVKTTLQFPDGERKRVIVDDAFFGNLPNAMPARDEYVNMKFDFSATQVRFI